MTSLWTLLRRAPWRPLVYLPVATVLSALALLGLGLAGAFLAILLVFGLPYGLGERRVRTLAAAALAVAVLTGVTLAAVATWDAFRAEPPHHVSEDGVLSEGTVDPVHGDADTRFAFRVVYTHPEPPGRAPVANLTSTFLGGTTVRSHDMVLADPASASHAAGAVYVVLAELEAGTHRLHFAVQLPDGRWVETFDVSGPTPFPRGPVNLPPLAHFGILASGLVPFSLLAVGVPTLVVVGVYRWVRGGQPRRGVEG